jgi:hypothetical protein
MYKNTIFVLGEAIMSVNINGMPQILQSQSSFSKKTKASDRSAFANLVNKTNSENFSHQTYSNKQSLQQKGLSSSMFGSDGFGLGDIVDVVNPLQHIPILNVFYRNITGDEIGSAAEVAGGAVFGGLIGAGVKAINVAINSFTGKNIGEHVIAMFDDNKTNNPYKNQKATSYAKNNQTLPYRPPANINWTDPVQAKLDEQNKKLKEQNNIKLAQDFSVPVKEDYYKKSLEVYKASEEAKQKQYDVTTKMFENSHFYDLNKSENYKFYDIDKENHASTNIASIHKTSASPYENKANFSKTPIEDIFNHKRSENWGMSTNQENIDYETFANIINAQNSSNLNSSPDEGYLQKARQTAKKIQRKINETPSNQNDSVIYKNYGNNSRSSIGLF